MISRALPLVLAAFFLSHPQMRADIFTVTNTTESGPGSIGQAILDANAHPNSPASDPDRIHFAIMGDDIQLILPLFPLPDITDPVVIDGFTQNGALPNSNPVGQGLNPTLRIELNGQNLWVEGNGLTITCGHSTVRGLIINGFQSAILFRGTGENSVEGNYLGNWRAKLISLLLATTLWQAAISELANISTRGFVESGDNVMIGGLIIRPVGGGSATVVARAIGPTLSSFGISGALQDPTLDLVNSEGMVIRSNNNWRDVQQTEIEALGLQPGDDRESALVQALVPGNYTAVVRGNGNTTGVALAEIYHVQ